MTVKSNTRNSPNQGNKPKKTQGIKKKTGPTVNGSQLTSSTSGHPSKTGSPEQPVKQRVEQVASPLVRELTVSPVAEQVAEKVEETTSRPTILDRPVSGRQWNDSRIPSLEDHIRIVQMLYGTDRGMKKASKDLAVRLGVSQKEALEALRACN